MIIFRWEKQRFTQRKVKISLSLSGCTINLLLKPVSVHQSKNISAEVYSAQGCRVRIGIELRLGTRVDFTGDMKVVSLLWEKNNLHS